MKLIQKITLIFLFAFFTTNSFPQLISEKEKTIDSLFTMVKKITPENKFDKSLGKFAISDIDLEKAKKLLYNAYANTPLEYQEKLDEWTAEWVSTAVKGVRGPEGIKPSIRIKRIKEGIEQKYGSEYLKYLETPYFLKVKIISESTTEYLTRQKNIKFLKVRLQCQIIDIVKGKEKFSIGDTIIISYLPIWSREITLPKFEVNALYALPLKHWIKQDNLLAAEFMLKLNGYNSLYKIENNVVTTPLIPEEKPRETWEQFKKTFESKYLINE